MILPSLPLNSSPRAALYRALIFSFLFAAVMAILPASEARAGAAVSCFGQPATITGTNASETLNGTPANDVIAALGGNDVVFGNGGDDRICAAGGNDQVHAGPGRDRANGGRGNDQLFGQDGNDTLVGAGGSDLLGGGPGTDTCKGKQGSDTAECEKEVAVEGTGPSPGPSPSLADCPVLPADNAWNMRVDGLPVHANSQDFIESINSSGGNGFLHADFGENQSYGIPFVTVPEAQPLVPITFDPYGEESDPGPYPIPLNAPVESGSDRHVIAFQTGSCVLWELFDAERSGSGWAAASGARWDMHSNALRPERWTSADAAGLPIFPGLARCAEVLAGEINHALRFTASRTQKAYIHPATHWASSSTDADDPPMGLRLRLKASYDISSFDGQARVVLEALRTYGMILADNGGSWFISGATDTCWDDDDLDQLKTVPGSAFEAVSTGPIVTP